MTGNKNWSSVRLGEKRIQAVYRGFDLVWIAVSKYWKRRDVWKKKELW